jgi:RimJ/RimL family protein N-acetyltransferase
MRKLPTIESERLVLMPLEPKHADAVVKLANDPELAATTLHITHPYDIDDAFSWMKRHPVEWDKQTGLTLGVFIKNPEGKEPEIVGAISLLSINFQAELGYWIGRKFWGQGYATEAAKTLIQFGFHVLRLHRIHAQHMSHNPASGKVMQKAGMSYEGHRPLHLWKKGVGHNIELYGIINPNPTAYNPSRIECDDEEYDPT